MNSDIIKSILNEKKKKKKKKKPIGRLYSIIPVFSDPTIGTPEGMEEGLNLSKKKPLPFRYFDVHVCDQSFYDDDGDEYECAEGHSVFCKIPQNKIPDWYPIYSQEDVASNSFDREDASDIVRWAIKNKKINDVESADINYIEEISEEEYNQLALGQYDNETELDEEGGLSDTLGANTSQNIPKWESGITRGKANPIDFKKPWESGITRGKANSLFEGLNLPKKQLEHPLFNILDQVISKVENVNKPNIGKNLFGLYSNVLSKKMKMIEMLRYPSGKWSMRLYYIPFVKPLLEQFTIDKKQFEQLVGEWFILRHGDKIILNEGLNLPKKPISKKRIRIYLDGTDRLVIDIPEKRLHELVDKRLVWTLGGRWVTISTTDELFDALNE